MSKLKTVHCAMLYFQCVLDHCYFKGQFLTVWVDVNSVLCERQSSIAELLSSYWNYICNYAYYCMVKNTKCGKDI